MNGARTYRQKIQNGRVLARSTGAARRAETKSARSGRSGEAKAPSGQSLILILVGIGLAVVGTSLLALRIQSDIRKLGVDDAALKAKIHRLGHAQQAELLRQQQVLNEVEKSALLDPELTAPKSNAPSLPATAPRQLKETTEKVKGTGADRGARLAKRDEAGRRKTEVSRRAIDRRQGDEARMKRKSGNTRGDGMIARTSTVNSSAGRTDR